MSLKSELTCNICALVLKDPITLPCLSAICREHLNDVAAKNSLIKCMKCDKEFEVPESGFRSNEMANNIIEKELYLSDEEKTIKHAIENLIQKLEGLKKDVKQKIFDLERTHCDHFSEVRSQIDIQREELKAKIDEISLKMIDQVNDMEKEHKTKMEEAILATCTQDTQKSREILVQEFRKPGLLIQEVNRLQSEHEQSVQEIQARINEFDWISDEVKAFEFKASEGIRDESFGLLKMSKPDGLVACTFETMIKIWDLESRECVATLEGHFGDTYCLENIDKHRFASGSEDNTIKVWDSKSFVCLKTLSDCHQHGVKCLTYVPSSKIASGSFQEIKIWDIDGEKCVQTLNGHTDCVYEIVCLTKGKIASCSFDQTIIVWDLEKGTCLRTLSGHMDQVSCIALLKSGHLASGSWDTTIKIWNLDSGECVKTLEGHSSYVLGLQALENGEFISCSHDKTIKIWDLKIEEEDSCVKTLEGHTEWITSIRTNKRRNTLVSCSEDKTIKTWDLKTGECVNTVDVPGLSELWDLIFVYI